MIDDVAETRSCLLSNQKRQLHLPLDHPPPSTRRHCCSWKLLRSARVVQSSRAHQPELPTRANCCLKMRQCNYRNENASSNDFAFSRLSRHPFSCPSTLLSSDSICVLCCYSSCLGSWRTGDIESSWQPCSMHDCSNALWYPQFVWPLSEASAPAANHSCLAQSPLKDIRYPVQPASPTLLYCSIFWLPFWLFTVDLSIVSST